MQHDLKYGLTLEQYRTMEPHLTRPLTFGGIQKRPRKDPLLHEVRDLSEIQLKPWSSARQKRDSRSRKGQAPV